MAGGALKTDVSHAARRGRGGSYPPPPRTDPGVRYYRTGLFRQPRFRNSPQSWRLGYPPQGGLPC